MQLSTIFANREASSRDMQQFRNSDTTTLVDALAEYSEKYYRLISAGGSEKDITHCRMAIHQILLEINSQKKRTSEFNRENIGKK
jgi:hypothetical protein